MYVHVYTCHMFCCSRTCMYVGYHTYVRICTNFKINPTKNFSYYFAMLISHYAAFVDVVVIQPRLPAYGIRNNVLCYGVRACMYIHTEEEGTRVMYVHCTIQYDTNPYARVINNKLTTIFIKLIPANLAPCHLTQGDQRTHGTACLRPPTTYLELVGKLKYESRPLST